ncbi:sulfatase-like hydrolase/transferase, partial [candidate division KSB1 bacterium]|nr:sulfatase-like hydrolase/transferase [candidate division KSB1 bacterium]
MSKQFPNRRDFLKTAGASATILLLHGCQNQPVKSAERPNILWITCEDMSPALGCYGDAYARTPNLDKLASEGILYRQAYATAPICSPSRSCLITGLY